MEYSLESSDFRMKFNNLIKVLNLFIYYSDVNAYYCPKLCIIKVISSRIFISQLKISHSKITQNNICIF